ncbi:unnamed protein product [Diatraea saccharalis]|uniref:Uncharacterized protein n=1 Tax=Diatraea saccharalis TaxID=40085 RepID=A0A9N9RAY5_9NEOP|nr:unnamed protein product [Diatraea saccharalis]
MSELKKKPSGAAYKRKAMEKEEKHQNVIKHTKPIEFYFSKLKSDDAESSNAIYHASATEPIQCEIPTSSKQPQDLPAPTPPTPPAVEVERQLQNKLVIVDCDPWVNVPLNALKRLVGCLQEIYSFFTASTQRWETLQAQILLDACKSLKESFPEIRDALIAIESNPEQKRSVLCEAKGIRLKLERLETAFMTVFWDFILVHMNKTNKNLQSVDIDICTVIQINDSLIQIISAERENFYKYEQQALELSLVKEYEKDTKRIRKRKLTADESADDITFSLSGRETFRVAVYLVIIDRLVVELQKRREAYSNFYSKFSFLRNLINLNNEEVKNKANILVTMYSGYLEKCFVDECIHLRSYLITIARDGELPRTTNAILQIIRNRELETIYPNVDIALRMCVSTAVSNCSGNMFSRGKKIVAACLENCSSPEAVLDTHSDLGESPSLLQPDRENLPNSDHDKTRQFNSATKNKENTEVSTCLSNYSQQQDLITLADLGEPSHLLQSNLDDIVSSTNFDSEIAALTSFSSDVDNIENINLEVLGAESDTDFSSNDSVQDPNFLPNNDSDILSETSNQQRKKAKRGRSDKSQWKYEQQKSKRMKGEKYLGRRRNEEGKIV